MVRDGALYLCSSRKQLSGVSALMERRWVREEEGRTSHVFRFFTVVPLPGREAARAFLFSRVFSSNPNIFMSQILFAPFHWEVCQVPTWEVPPFQVEVEEEGEKPQCFSAVLIFSEAGHCQIMQYYEFAFP